MKTLRFLLFCLFLSPAQGFAATSATEKAIAALQVAADLRNSVVNDTDSDGEDSDCSETTANFILKLKALLDNPEADAIVWGVDTDGSSLILVNHDRFAEQLINYYKTNNLKSFVRQLHFYGFKKINKKFVKGFVAYKSKFFTQGGELLHKIKRQTHSSDKSLKKLQSKTKSLQEKLAITQKAMAQMAEALNVMLLEQKSDFLRASSGSSKAPRAEGLRRKRKQADSPLPLPFLSSDLSPISMKDLFKAEDDDFSLCSPVSPVVLDEQESIFSFKI